jgi:hypothetical protein
VQSSKGNLIPAKAKTNSTTVRLGFEAKLWLPTEIRGNNMAPAKVLPAAPS